MTRLRSAVQQIRRLLNDGLCPESTLDFTLSEFDVQSRRSNAATPDSLETLFFQHRGRIVHKWIHYLPIYDQWFAPYRGKKVHMLEIGVSQGGSLELWRKYLGQDAVIFGIDVNPACADRVDEPNQVRIGSQNDPAFLHRVVAEMGRVDVILDDGSHIAKHQQTAFRHLFPFLSDGGLYIIEDLHTSYWRGRFGGGYRRQGTAIELAKSIVDDMHGWYHARRMRYVSRTSIHSVSFYDSMVVVQKRMMPRPGHFKMPHQ